MVVSKQLTDYSLSSNHLEQYSLDPLLLDIQGNTAPAQPGGQPVERIVTLYNHGHQVADIDLWIAPVDLRSEVVKKWIEISYSMPELVLQPQEGIDITLLITVPPEAEAGFYSYEVCACSAQYGNLEMRKPQQLHVIGDDLLGLPGQEPDLKIAPATSPEAPHSFVPGEPLNLIATVQNHSRRTDRYFLFLLDVPSDWFSTEYPENSANLPGLITRTDGLQLNPGESGDIILRVHPPAFTPAGEYFPTVQLSGSNRDEVVLLEVAYLSIPIVDSLKVTLTPENQLIPPQRASFEIAVHNTGNINRHLSLTVQDQANAFAFKLTPNVLELPANQEALIELEARPRRWLSRLCHRRAQTVVFDVAVENVVEVIDEVPYQFTPLSAPALPAVLPKGHLNWQPYRRWLFWLVLISSIVGSVSVVSWIAWYFFVWRPNLRPKVLIFNPTNEGFQEDGAQPISFDWDISNVDSVGSIQLDWEGAKEPIIYSFADDAEGKVKGQPVKRIPDELESYCQLTETVDKRTGAFVAPLLRFHRRRRTGSENLQVLQCRSLTLPSFQLPEGEYGFTLKTFAGESGQNLQDVGKLDRKLTITAPPSPMVTALTPGAAFYSQTSNGLLQPIDLNGDTSKSTKPLPSVPVSWQVTNTQKLKSLRLGSLAMDGNQNLQEQVFDFSDGLPAGLDPFCRSDNHTLTCDNVPTLARNFDYYNFYMQAVSSDADAKGGDVIAPARIQAPTISIAPPLPEIVSFNFDGQSTLNMPKQIIRMQPNQASGSIVLSWEVKNAAKVELLPSPGPVEVNQIAYPISATSGKEIITLRAVNAVGEEVTQSIVIEVVVNKPS